MNTIMGNDYKWQGRGTGLPSGHRIFESHNPDVAKGNHWAVADDSGAYPHTCEDGVLWLDTMRPLQIGEHMCVAPVINDDKQQQYIGCGPATILWLAREFRWAIEDKQRARFFNAAMVPGTFVEPQPERYLLALALGSGQLRGTETEERIKLFFEAYGIDYKAMCG